MSNYFNGNGTIGFTCDVCGRELNSCSIVNGMKFCAKCYQETFGKDNQQNEIQKLKQQLEEKNREIERLKKNHRISYTNQKRIYEKLKNSINTKSLIKYPLRLDGCLIKNEQDLFDYAKESTLDIKYLRNERTKIVITELEKVKNQLKDKIKMMSNEEHYYQQRVVNWHDICNQINNQIKELKGE